MKNIEFECVVQNLRRASRLVSRRYERALKPVNLTSSQFTIFQSLAGRAGLPHGLMAEILGFEQTTLTRLLKPLEKRGLVLIEPNPKDRREKIVKQTKQGEELFKEAKRLWRVEQNKSLGELDDAEWVAMKAALKRLSDI